jgi:glutamate/tyrosine decarboxylase-like PLP-dependent enzyme
MPGGASGLLTSGGSAATLTAIVAARHAAVGEDASRLARLTMYTSDQGHSSVARAGWIAGIPRTQVRVVESDEHFRLRVDALRAAIRRDRAAGLIPFLVVATAGTTNTGAVDPLHAVADLCDAESTWLHVDAAYAGFGALSQRGRAALDGLGRAHTVTLDPHKWLFVPFECGCVLARDPRALSAAFRIYPEYLKDVESGGADVNFADYGEQLTRYSRALKVWLSVGYFGLAAIRGAIERGMELAALAERLLRATPGIEITSAAQFGIVCFRVRPEGLDDAAALDELNARVNEYVNHTGGFLISSTRLRGAFSLRACVVAYRATEDDIRALVAAVAEGARRCSS